MSDKVFIRHLWKEEEDFHIHTCKRCGVQRKRKANYKRSGYWYHEYFVDGEWTDESPKCIAKLQT